MGCLEKGGVVIRGGGRDQFFRGYESSNEIIS